MASYGTKFVPISCVIFVLLVIFHNTPALGGCPRAGRCSGISGLRRDLRLTITALIPTSRHLAGLTARAYSYTNFEFNVTDFCNPTCNSFTLSLMADMNLTTSSWKSASRSTLLEFHRRATLGYMEELRQSMAELARVQKVTSPPAYLKKLDDFMQDPVKGLIRKAVKIDRKLGNLPALNTTAGQQHSFSPVRPQSLDTLACHISQCVLSDLYVVANQMVVDFSKMKTGLLMEK